MQCLNSTSILTCLTSLHILTKAQSCQRDGEGQREREREGRKQGGRAGEGEIEREQEFERWEMEREERDGERGNKQRGALFLTPEGCWRELVGGGGRKGEVERNGVVERNGEKERQHLRAMREG